MAVFNPRKRAVNFRLSEDEFESLKRACVAKGAHSLSDFARAAVRQFVSSGSGSTRSLESAMKRIDSRLRRLQRELNHLSKLLEVARSQPSN